MMEKMSKTQLFYRSCILAACVALGGVLGVARAHSTGKETRILAQCDKFPAADRQACKACLTRALKHHYHPDYPAGARCRPDNGKP